MKQRLMAPELWEELNKQLNSMLENGVINSGKSAWGLVPHFVKKKNRKWRMCLDFHEN